MGTPAAVVPPSRLERMSLRTMPDRSRTSGPLDPSPGYGPAVSSGISPVDAAALAAAGARGTGRACGERDGSDAGPEVREHGPAAEQRPEVEAGALVDHLLVGAGEEPALVGAAVGRAVGFGDAGHVGASWSGSRRSGRDHRAGRSDAPAMAIR